MRLIFVALLWIGTFSASNKLILCCMMMRFVPAVRSQFNVSKNAIVRRKKKKTIYVFSKALVIWSFISFLRVLVRSPAGTTVACLCSFTRYHFTCLQRSLNRWNYTIYCPYLVFMFKNGISGPFGPHNTSTAPLYMRWPYIRISLLRSSSLNQVCIRLSPPPINHHHHHHNWYFGSIAVRRTQHSTAHTNLQHFHS